MPVHLVIKATPSHTTSRSIAKKSMVFNFRHKLILYSKTDKQIHNYTLQPDGICSLLIPCLWCITRYLAANCMYVGSFNHRLFIYQPIPLPPTISIIFFSFKKMQCVFLVQLLPMMIMFPIKVKTCLTVHTRNTI